MVVEEPLNWYFTRFDCLKYPNKVSHGDVLYGGRSFAVQAARLWNELSDNPRSTRTAGIFRQIALEQYTLDFAAYKCKFVIFIIVTTTEGKDTPQKNLGK